MSELATRTDESARSPIQFFLPNDRFPGHIPTNIDPDDIALKDDIYAEIIPTYVHLKNSGFPCTLVKELPHSGIVIAHRDCLEPGGYLQPHPDVFLIALQANRYLSAYANLHLVQSSCHQAHVHNSYVLPPWPTPGIRPRLTSRGARFENIAYIGHLDDLAIGLKHYSFCQQLQALGLKWQTFIHFDTRADYRNIDAIVALKHLAEMPYPTGLQNARKLFDAWIAGVPIVLKNGGVYQAHRQSELDYIAIDVASNNTSENPFERVVSALSQLKAQPTLRQSMIAHGKKRAQEIEPTALVKQWSTFLETVAMPAAYQWQQLPIGLRRLKRWQQQCRCQSYNRKINKQLSTSFETVSHQLPFDLAQKL